MLHEHGSRTWMVLLRINTRAHSGIIEASLVSVYPRNASRMAYRTVLLVGCPMISDEQEYCPDG